MASECLQGLGLRLSRFRVRIVSGKPKALE